MTEREKKRALERSQWPLDASHPRQIQLLRLDFLFSHPGANTKKLFLHAKYIKNGFLPTCVIADCDCSRCALQEVLSVAPADQLRPSSSDVTRDATVKLDEVPAVARYPLVATKTLPPQFAEQLADRQPQNRTLAINSVISRVHYKKRI